MVLQQLRHRIAQMGGTLPGCSEWNTMIEENAGGRHQQCDFRPVAKSVPKPISQGRDCKRDTHTHAKRRTQPLLGGGLVAGSIVLIGGEPGIRKIDTCITKHIIDTRQAHIVCKRRRGTSQLKMRADRIGQLSDNCYIVCDTSLENILGHAESLNPEIMVVDSIQTIASDSIESSARKRKPGERMRGTTAAICQIDRCACAPYRPHKQGRLYRRTQSAGTYRRRRVAVWKATGIICTAYSVY